MKRNLIRRLRKTTVLSIGSILISQLLHAQSGKDTAAIPVFFKPLDSVEVNAPGYRGYVQPLSSSATRSAARVIDVPQTISSVSRQLMDDKMEINLRDAVNDAAGVNSYSGYDEYTIRGFRAENARNLNGLRGYNTTYTSAMLLNIQSVDVVKGPAAALYGNSDPGGNVDLVTKKPLPKPGGELAVFGGSWNHFRATGDVTGPLNKEASLLYRLNTGYDQTQSFRNGNFAKNTQIAPSFSFMPKSGKLRLDLDLNYAGVNTVLDRGQPGLRNSADLKATPRRFSVIQPGDYLKESDLAASLRFEWKISKNIIFHSGYLHYNTWQKLAEHGLNDYVTDDSVSLYFQKWRFNSSTNTLSNYFDFKFNSGPLSHDLLVGDDYVSSTNSVTANRYELADRFGEGSGIVGGFALTHPVYERRPTGSYTESEDDVDLDADKYHTNGIYFQDQVTWKKWQLLLGVRREFYRSPADDDSGAVATVQNIWLPRLGLVYNIAPSLNVYGVYSRGFDPYEASTAVQEFEEPFRPIQSELFEAGVKAGFLQNKLYATLSVYQLSLFNVAVNANDIGNPDLYTQRGEDQARGVETEINGNLLPNLSIHLTYAYNVAQIKKSDVKDDIGRLKENAPRNVSNSLFRYQFASGALHGFTVLAGHSWVSKRNTLDQDIQLPGYLTIMGGLGYSFNRIAISANLNNITNKEYWVGGYNNINKWPGQPRNILVKLNWRFGAKE